MNVVDVLIVGAGPAGASAAVWARRAGLDVLLVDRAAAGRDKCCGDGLTALALRELESLGLQPEQMGSWQHVAAACVRTPQGRVMRLPLPAGRGQFAAVCRRAELDAGLIDLAAAEDADVRLGVAFDGFEDTGAQTSTASVRLSDGDVVRARFVVAADGVYSAVRKALGIGPHRYRGDWHAFRGYLRASGAAAHDMWVWFEPDLLPGYAWSFPLGDGRVNVGFGVPRDHRRYEAGVGTGTLAGREIAAVWAGLTERRHIESVLGSHEPDGPTRAWPIPARLGELTLAQGRTLLCGDAAAAADPLTGEGIGQALQMGRMAATAIARGGPPHSVTARYVREAQAEFVLDHRLARGLSRVLARERLAELSLRAVDWSAWTRRQFARWMFEDYPRAAVATPRRWHRGMAAARGAYDPASRPVAVTTTSSPS
ncbi:NAD(P)/FAD-dependent oxidoreductase [Candidatus Poriferisodalis sp.]|uniref:NAD(P)/FAD-dependent oxidoreductase n=1 Tax=Candidatus Poriferisodalis sp. TaxID=3101277 RepID=UPI003B0149BF